MTTNIDDIKDPEAGLEKVSKALEELDRERKIRDDLIDVELECALAARVVLSLAALSKFYESERHRVKELVEKGDDPEVRELQRLELEALIYEIGMTASVAVALAHLWDFHEAKHRMSSLFDGLHDKLNQTRKAMEN